MIRDEEMARRFPHGVTYLGPNTSYPASERCPELRQADKRIDRFTPVTPDRQGYIWTLLKRADAPVKREAETPTQYLKRLDKWSCKLMSDARMGLRAKGNPSALRRRWAGFTLLLEAGVKE